MMKAEHSRPSTAPGGRVFNVTRGQSLANRLAVADTHWSRFCGLMGKPAASFPQGSALWIVPCRGIHTFAMRFPIDAVYLDRERIVIHIEEELKPWRLAAVRVHAASVLELPTGTIRESLTVVGDQVDISFEERPIHTEAA